MTENTGVRIRTILYTSFDVTEAFNLFFIPLQIDVRLPEYSYLKE